MDTRTSVNSLDCLDTLLMSYANSPQVGSPLGYKFGETRFDKLKLERVGERLKKIHTVLKTFQKHHVTLKLSKFLIQQNTFDKRIFVIVDMCTNSFPKDLQEHFRCPFPGFIFNFISMSWIIIHDWMTNRENFSSLLKMFNAWNVFSSLLDIMASKCHRIVPYPFI